MSEQWCIGIHEVREAAGRISGLAHKTPVLTSAYLDQLSSATVWFKCENFQKVGAFKFRGAANAVFNLSEPQARRGVVTHSSGNHAQALSLAARLRDITATIVMPSTAPKVKVAAVRGYGGKVIFCEPNLTAREQAAQAVIDETGAVLIHPYDNPQIIAGQGTASLEFLEQHPDLDLIVAPVGGGGLLSGTAVVAREFPDLEVLGAEPSGADDAARSLAAGRIIPSVSPQTIADGLLTSLGELTFPIIRDGVNRIVTVDDEAIVSAMRILWERMKIVVEPSAAVPLAALLSEKVAIRGRKIGVVLSGGNVDLERLPWNQVTESI